MIYLTNDLNSFLTAVTILFFMYNGIMKFPISINQILQWCQLFIRTKKDIIDEASNEDDRRYTVSIHLSFYISIYLSIYTSISL
jgi:hypothetical protein